METRSRTLTKALLWQAMGFAMTILVGWWLTGSAFIGGTLGAVNMVAGLVIYVIYERVWDKVRWGRRMPNG